MTTNAAINEMFEEIKESLKSIEGKLSGKADPNVKMDEELARQRRQNRQTIEQILQQIGQRLQNIDRDSNSIQSGIQDSERRIISAIENQKKKLSFLDKVRVKTNTVVWTIGILLSFSIGSTSVNVLLFKRMKIMEENNFKYDFIKSQGGITKEQLLRLDSLIHENR